MKKITEVVTDEAGNIVVGAEVFIRKQSDSSLVTLYSDEGITQTANPSVSGVDGRVEVWAANNTLKIQTYIDGEEANDPIEYYQHYDLSVITAAAWTILDDASVAAIATTLGLGTGDSPQLTAVNIGHATDTTVSRASAGDIAVEGNIVYRAGGTDVPVTDGGTGSSTAGGARTNLGLGTIAILDETTTAQYRSNAADKALSTDQVWAAADYVGLTDAATVDVDMSLGFNFSLAITDNRTLGAPTNTKNGQTGAIVITQDGTGSRTLAYHANWKFAGGTDPTLSTAAGAVDILFYQVVSSTFIFGTLIKALA